MEVISERMGWRDRAISERHRHWGLSCPAVDIDFLLVEYGLGKPVALVEYKYHLADHPNLSHPTYRALRDLADNYRNEGLPFFLAFYWRDIWAFRVKPVNTAALGWLDSSSFHDLTEVQWVTLLYAIRSRAIDDTVRSRAIDDTVLARLNTHLPP